MDLQSLLQARLAESQANRRPQREEIDKHMRERIIEEFRRDPEVASLINQLARTREELDHAKSITRRDTDPSLIAARKRLRQPGGGVQRSLEHKASRSVSGC